MRKWQVEKEVTVCVSNHYCSRGRITAAAPSVSLQTRDSPPPVSVCGSTCKHAPRPLSLLTVTVTAPNSRAPWKTPPCVRRGLPSESSRSNSASWSLTSLHRADTSTPRSAMTGSTAAGCRRVLAKWQPTPGTVQHGLKTTTKESGAGASGGGVYSISSTPWLRHDCRRWEGLSVTWPASTMLTMGPGIERTLYAPCWW